MIACIKAAQVGEGGGKWGDYLRPSCCDDGANILWVSRLKEEKHIGIASASVDDTDAIPATKRSFPLLWETLSLSK